MVRTGIPGYNPTDRDSGGTDGGDTVDAGTVNVADELDDSGGRDLSDRPDSGTSNTGTDRENDFGRELGGDPAESGGSNTGASPAPDPEPSGGSSGGASTGADLIDDVTGDSDRSGSTTPGFDTSDGGSSSGTDPADEFGREIGGDPAESGGSNIGASPAQEPEPTPSPTRRAGTEQSIPDGASDRGGPIERVRDAASDRIDRLTDTEPDRDITDRLTTGGFLSEQSDTNEGLLPGEVAGFDVSEQRFRDEAQRTRRARNRRFEESEELTIGGSDLPDRVVTGAAQAASDIANPAGLLTSAETAVEVGTSAPSTILDEGGRDVATTAGAVGLTAGAATVDSAQENPAGFAGGAVFNVVGGAGAGSQLGRLGRATRDRTRTAGGTKIDVEELASEDVIRNVETDGAEGDRFPGADDPELYLSDPAEAVRQQADANTPQQIDDAFSDAGIEDGTTLTKALDVEPEGPGRGRADTGFSSAPGETLEEFDYETPGSFAGPELSPNFLGLGGSGGGFSFRPGTPDTGNNPTAVLARTDVENTDADTLDEFNQEMIDRAGDTTAVTKPANEVNVGEIEAVVPPGAQFRSVGSGGVRGALQRVGIGSDFYTEIGGRRVPLRTVAPDRDRGDSDVLDDSGGSSTRNTGAGSLDELSERVETPTDRPVPGFGIGGSGAGESSSPTDSGVSGSPFGDVSSGFSSGSGGGSGGGGSPPGSGGTPPGTSNRPGSGSPGPSGGPSGGSGGGFGGGGGPAPTSAASQPTSPSGFDSPTQRRSRQRSDDEASDDESAFNFLVEEDTDEFGSGILSGEEAAEQFFGR
jgi:hypothetical protein